MMPEAEIQYVSNESGEPTAVIVPISLWRDIASERETAHLLKSETMKRRLLEAKERQQGSRLTKPVKNLEFDAAAFEDLAWVLQTPAFISCLHVGRDTAT
jgi:antitoxin YefM